MSGTPSPKPKRGIVCPTCGSSTFVRHVRRPCAGLVVRYRRCRKCRAKVVTRETVREAVG